MTTHIKLTCDGCDATTDTARVKAEFHSFSGRGYGFGKWREPSISEAVAPTGWVWSDPVTACTYCPTCLAEIEGGKPVEPMSAIQ